MDADLRSLVIARAGDRCEYCRLPQSATPIASFHIEHIVAQQHHGPTTEQNLALACDRCNAYKGPNLSSVDPETADVVPLFHPRRDEWAEHFDLVDGYILGRSPTGRAISRLLQMNSPRRVELRRFSHDELPG